MQDTPGKGKAIGSLVCGIISLVFAWFGIFAFAGIALGIVGLILASLANKEGFVGGMQTAGFVLSLIGLILSGILFLTCGVCTCITAGTLGSLGTIY